MEKKIYNLKMIPFDIFVPIEKDSQFTVELTEEEYQNYNEILERFEYWQNKLIGAIK